MKRILLATVAAAALAFPAMAPAAPNQGNQQTKVPMQNQQAMQSAGQRINPKQMSKQQIRQVQDALNSKGFKVHADGIWGPKTEAALRKFQKQQNISAKGQITDQTLAKLGVNNGEGTNAETTGQGMSGQNNTANPSAQNQNNNAQSESTNGMNAQNPNPGSTNAKTAPQNGTPGSASSSTTGSGTGNMNPNPTPPVNQSGSSSSGSGSSGSGSK